MITDISTIIRSDKYLPDTAKQIHIRESLGYTKEIKYIHLPDILNAQTNKRHNFCKMAY